MQTSSVLIYIMEYEHKIRKEQTHILFYMKKIQNAWVITIMSIVVSVIIYLFIAYLFSMADFTLGLIITIVIPAVIAYPISNVTIKSHRKIESQKVEIENSQDRINQSIKYASRIQNALFPPERLFTQNFNSHFILYKPKDVVSGDFYYLKETQNSCIIAVADCTGHGVPGAFVSMLGISFLNEIITGKGEKNAAQILEELRQKVKISLNQTDHNSTSKDGMDIAICVINKETKRLSFSGANNPLYIFRENHFDEIKATRNPIGTHPKEIDFVNNEIQLQEKDKFYIFSDGYMDQFGGEKGTKFKKNRFRELIKTVHSKPFVDQHKIINNTLNNWQTNTEQTDDILVIGIEM